MAKSWTCARCSAPNPESTLTCGTCRMIRGAVVVPSAYNSLPTLPAHLKSAAPPAMEPDGSTVNEWAVHANERPRLLAPVPVIGLFVALFAVAVGVAIWFNADRSSTGEIVDPGNLTVDELRLGDCFDLKSEATEFADVTARPCSDAHEYEVFWSSSMRDGGYPSEAAFASYFEAHCYDAFEDYVGVAYPDTPLDIYWLVPNKNGWSMGQRYMHCAVFDPDNPRLTGTLKGAGPSQDSPALPLS